MKLFNLNSNHLKRLAILSSFMLLLLWGISVSAATYSQLWRTDGQLNLAGRWIFFVGAKKIPYKVFLNQKRTAHDQYQLTGYMLDPKGKRFTFTKGDVIHGNGRHPVFAMSLYEGESLWQCFLNSDRKGIWWEGEVWHAKTKKFQADFKANKL